MICIGIDPGVTGAVAVLRDGIEPIDVIDMPTVGRGAKGRQTVNAAALADFLRPYADGVAAIEQVSAMPGQGVSSTFRFGESFGAAQGVLAALRIRTLRPTPQTWKRHHTLIGKDKDAARALAIDLFPDASLARKRDVGRADALLIAAWAHHESVRIAA